MVVSVGAARFFSKAIPAALISDRREANGAMGKKGTRIHIVYSRLSEQERAWLERMASTERRTMSDMIRQSVAEAAARRGLAKEDAA